LQIHVLDVADIVGVGAFALSGFLIAVRKQLDLLGVFLFAFLTALGGGIIRDVIVERTPISLKDSLPSVIVIIVVFFALILQISKKKRVERFKIFILSDAVGLASFSISGALVALQSDFNFFGTIILSLSTAIGGGVLRDMLINEVPVILTSGFYASVSVFIATCLYVAHFFNYLNGTTISLIFILGLSLRMVAFYKEWKLPVL